jgi:hypothetical protein
LCDIEREQSHCALQAGELILREPYTVALLGRLHQRAVSHGEHDRGDEQGDYQFE